jgi:spectinomycin phosphotransferase
MIEPPQDLPPATIVARVRERYGIDVDEATFLPAGNDSSAWSYRLDGHAHRWFLKLFGRKIEPAAIETPHFLASRGIDHLIPSLATTDGEAYDAGEPFGSVLFPYVDAEPAGSKGLSAGDRTELGRFLRRVHGQQPDDRLLAMLRRERFEVRGAAYIERVGPSLDDREGVDPIAAALLATWRQQRDDIDRVLQRARELAAYGLSASPERVICHADFHAWNVLIEPGGTLHVVDWDEVVFAPRERDLMFVSGDVADIDPTGEHFYAGYGDVQIDRALLAYYRYDWVLQEIADYHRRVFDRSLGVRVREEALEYFTDLFGPEDVVAAAYRADAEIASA